MWSEIIERPDAGWEGLDSALLLHSARFRHLKIALNS